MQNVGGPVMLLWAPSRLIRELRAFCQPELQEQYRQAVVRRPETAGTACADMPSVALRPLGSDGGLLAAVEPIGLQATLLQEAAARCTLLTSALRLLAALPTLEAAAAAATAVLQAAGGCAARHPLRVLSLVRATPRTQAERALRSRLQTLGVGSAPEEGQHTIWCIEHRPSQHPSTADSQQQEQGSEVLLGLELATSWAAPAAARQLGPTAMLPELAAATASLAAVPAGGTVLDPFCGTGSLLVAALARGAGLAVGSDIDATHFAAHASPNGSGGGPPVLLRADAASLRGLLPAAVVDCILTDLPYGHRTALAAGPAGGASEAASAAAWAAAMEGVVAAEEAAAGAGSAAGGEAASAARVAEAGQELGWQRLFAVLLQLAAHVLAPGGRLAVWMPCVEECSPADGHGGGGSKGLAGEGCPAAAARLQHSLEVSGAALAPQLRLLHLLPESRRAGYPRALAVFERMPGADGGQPAAPGDAGERAAALLGALRTAASSLAAGQPAPMGGQPEPQQRLRSERSAGSEQLASRAAAAAPSAAQQRGLKYRQVRGTASGTAIDVWRAAWLGDAAAIAEYAAAGGDVNARDRKGQTPLQFAAGYRREVAVQLLLRLGADPSAAADASGMAALHRAAARGHVGTLRVLLAGGADAWQVSCPAGAGDGAAPMPGPGSGGGGPARQHSSCAGQTPLMYAAQFGHAAAVQALLEHVGSGCRGRGEAGVGPGAAEPPAGQLAAHLALRDAAGLAALHLAAQWGMAATAELLLAAGADADQRSACPRRLAPAHLAARWGHPEVLHVLQRYGADLELRCAGPGWTALQEAREWRRPACVQLLEAASCRAE